MNTTGNQNVLFLCTGLPATDHRDVNDPATVGDTDDERREAFETAYRDLESRITDFVRKIEEGASEVR